MKRKRKAAAIFSISLLLFLGGCAQADKGEEEKKEETASGQAGESSADPDLGGEKSAIEEYEIKYASGEFTADDYKELANLYGEEGMRKRQRDLLEQCYRLYNDVQCIELLKDITVNIEEESDGIKVEAERLLSNLSTPGYVDEAAGMLLSDDWQSLMMPKLREGSRRYYMTDEAGKMTLCFEAGYDEAGEKYSSAWYAADDGSVSGLMRREDSLQMLTSKLVDGKYQGDFEAWLCMAGRGDVYHETGTFENGVCTGDYTAQVSYGHEASDLFALWSSRADMDMTEYKGAFEDGGITAVAQLDGSQKNVGSGEDNFIVYAYTADKSGYLFVNVPEEAEAGSFVFDCSVLGMEAYPEVVLYEPQTKNDSGTQEQMIDSGAVKVRIYDSNIEWFDGSRWHVLGTVEDYRKADPFEAYGKEQFPADNEDAETDNEIGETNGGTEKTGGSKSKPYENRGVGIIKKDVQEGTSKPSKAGKGKTSSAPAPSGTEVPAVPTAPKQPATQAPSPAGSGDSSQNNAGGQSAGGGSTGSGGQSAGGSSDSGGQSSGGGNTDSGGSQPDSGSGGDNGGDSNSGDVDIEWTDDIL